MNHKLIKEKQNEFYDKITCEICKSSAAVLNSAGYDTFNLYFRLNTDKQYSDDWKENIDNTLFIFNVMTSIEFKAKHSSIVNTNFEKAIISLNEMKLSCEEIMVKSIIK